MNTAVTVQDAGAKLIESVVIGGDLAKLTPAQRVDYYRTVCDSVGLNPLTKPFDYLTLNGKLVLYANKTCADQLRRAQGVSLTIAARELIGDIYVVTARARAADGREDESTGAINVARLNGENLANAYMKCETKAKRRVTLSICGLGMLDESEVGSIPSARDVTVDPSTGEIIEPAPVASITRIAGYPMDQTIADDTRIAIESESQVVAAPANGNVAARNGAHHDADYTFTFGTHKGKRLDEVPAQYLDWCEQTFAASQYADKRACYDAVCAYKAGHRAAPADASADAWNPFDDAPAEEGAPVSHGNGLDSPGTPLPF